MRCSLRAVLCLLLLCNAGGAALAEADEPTANRFEWNELPELPDDHGLAGTMCGVHEDVLILAGGSNFPDFDGPKTFYDQIHVLRLVDGANLHWQKAGRLPRPLAHGAAVSTPRGVLCFGGTDDKSHFREVFLMRWNAERERVEIETGFPPLPTGCSYPSATSLENANGESVVYVAGGKNEQGELRNFWSLTLRTRTDARTEKQAKSVAWSKLPPWPGSKRFGPTLLTQSDGQRAAVYLFGGKSGDDYLTDAYQFVPDRQGEPWSKRTKMPRPALLAPAAAAGQSHILLFGGSDGHDVNGVNEFQADYRFTREILSYDTITDTWTTIGKTPEGVVVTSAIQWNDSIVIPGGELRPRVRTRKVQQAHYVSRKGFGLLDYLALAFYLLALVAIGIACGRRERDTGDFFLGGRRIPWWAAGLSLMATQVSSLGFMAIPAKTYATDWVYFTGVLTWFLVVPIVARVYIPFFRRLGGASAYEYLELRFHVSTRLLGALAFTLTQLGRMTIVLYLPALALSAVTGIDIYFCILLMGLLTTIYTIAGGIKAVVWTDVLQAIMLLAGGLACVLFVLWDLEGGVAEFFRIAHDNNKLRLVNPTWHFSTTALWVVLLGNVFSRLSTLTGDQAVVQRYLTTRDTPRAVRALWTDVAVSLPWALIVYLLGTALFVFYRTHPQLLDPMGKVDQIVPLFVAQQLPAGVSGLVIAAIFAAAMSSLDSSIHSVATVAVTDFHQRFFPGKSDRARLRLARLVILILGLFATGAAMLLSSVGVFSALDWFISVTGCSIGIVAGLFTLGMFTVRANSTGAVVGALVSAVSIWLLREHVHFFLYPVLGVSITTLVGYIVSLIAPGVARVEGLTVFTISDNTPR